jgi:hypothetical protein
MSLAMQIIAPWCAHSNPRTRDTLASSPGTPISRLAGDCWASNKTPIGKLAFPGSLAERLSYARRSVNNTETVITYGILPAKLQLCAARHPRSPGSRAVPPISLTQTLVSAGGAQAGNQRISRAQSSVKITTPKNATNTIANAVRFRRSAILSISHS